MVQQIPFVVKKATYRKHYLLCQNFGEPLYSAYKVSFRVSLLELLKEHYGNMWVCSLNKPVIR